jgi:hypothetical protein
MLASGPAYVRVRLDFARPARRLAEQTLLATSDFLRRASAEPQVAASRMNACTRTARDGQTSVRGDMNFASSEL